MIENEGEVYASGTYSIDDFVQLSVFHRRGFSIIVTIFVPLFFFIRNDFGFGLNFIISIPFILILVLLLIILSKSIFKYSARKQYHSDPLAKIERKFNITSTGITENIIGKSHTDFEWNDIRKSFELNNIFVLYLSNKTALLIPKSFFDSKEDIASFKEIANEKLKVKIKRKFI